MENNIDRAKQFMSFDALKGFRKMLEEKENIVSYRKKLGDDEYEELSNKIKNIKKRDNIELVYYLNKEYIKLRGVVKNIDFTNKMIVIDNIKINFNDIYEIDEYK